MFFNKTGELEDSITLSKGEVHVAKYIPFGSQIAPDVVKLRDNGDVCATWCLHGIPFETASPEQIASAKRELVNFLHGLRGSEAAEPCALWVHRVRRRFTDRLKGNFPSKFAQALNEKYFDRLGEQNMLKNELYFTLILRPSVRNNIRLAGSYTLGASEFHVNVGRAGSYGNIADSDATQYTVGYNHNLSKRTKVYGYFTRVNNSGNATYMTGVAGTGFSSVAVGIRHNF